jgi:GNAT superfamily N-acetyltransferase
MKSLLRWLCVGVFLFSQEAIAAPPGPRPRPVVVQRIDSRGHHERANAAIRPMKVSEVRALMPKLNDAETDFDSPPAFDYGKSNIKRELLVALDKFETGASKQAPEVLTTKVDGQERIVGMMFSHVKTEGPSQKVLYVDLLQSHKSSGFKGVGTQLMGAVFRRAQREGIGVELEAVPGSEGFYAGLGFTKVAGTDDKDSNDYRVWVLPKDSVHGAIQRIAFTGRRDR